MEKIDILFEGFKQKTLPNIDWHMTGDFSSRMNAVQHMFLGIETITELGTYQGCSTSAWLKLKPKKLITIDIKQYLDLPIFQMVAKDIGVHFEYIIANDMEIDIDPCDLLFIDTSHTEEHTYQELKKHGDKAKKYIAFHDIVEPKHQTAPGIKRYLQETSLWETHYKDTNGDGFLVLRRKRHG
jgi:predicted O-methyltransferase YrrM